MSLIKSGFFSMKKSSWGHCVSHSNSGNSTNLAVANEDPSIHIFPYSKAPLKQTVLGWEWWAAKTSNVVFVGLWE